MYKLFSSIIDMSTSASYLIIAVIAARLLLRKAPKNMRCFLWLLVGIRLVFPFSIESVFSLIPSSSLEGETLLYTYSPRIDYGVRRVGNFIGANTLPAAQTSAQKTITVGDVLAVVWVIGLVLMIGYMIFSWLRIKRRVAESVPKVIGIEEGLAVKIYQSDRIDTPFLFGIVRPRIYVPYDISEEDLPYVVMHENSHLKRRDYLIKPVGFLLLSVYWFNPLVWLAYILLCKDIELACDEKVIGMLGVDVEIKKSYSQALLACAVNRRVIAACPLAFGEVGVKTRVKNVLNYKKPAFWVILAAIIVCIIVTICFMTNKKNSTDNTADITETFEISEMSETSETVESVTADEPASDYEWVNTWAQEICARYAQEIVGMVEDSAIKYLEDNLELNIIMMDNGEQVATIGWSSPWPWDSQLDYEIVSAGNGQAVIRYYALTSEPHVTVWIESLEYDITDNVFKVTKENLKTYDSISSSSEFYEAYPDAIFSGTMMDYAFYNGMGEALYNNAIEENSKVYSYLFAPETSVIGILNLDEDAVDVEVDYIETDESGYSGDCEVTIKFANDNSEIKVYMRCYYAVYGIWLPYNVSLKDTNYIESDDDAGVVGQMGEEGVYYSAASLEEDYEKTVVYEMAADVTGDGIDDLIQLEAWINKEDTANKAKTPQQILKSGLYFYYVKIYKGISAKHYEDEAYFVSNDYGLSHVGNGYFCYTYRDGKPYLVTGSFWEGQGFAAYGYNVTELDNDGNAVVVDFGNADFAVWEDDWDERWKENLHREDVMPEYEESLKPWLENAVIVIATDISEGDGAFSSIDGECPASEYFDRIWERSY